MGAGAPLDTERLTGSYSVMGFFKQLMDPRVIDPVQDRRDDGLARMRQAERTIILIEQGDHLIELQEETNKLLKRLVERGGVTPLD